MPLIKPPELGRTLRRLHHAAEAAIKPGMNFGRWYETHGERVMLLRVDQWVLASRVRSAKLERAHLRLRRLYYARENILLARAVAAAYPTDHNRVWLLVEEARERDPLLEVPALAHWTLHEIRTVLDGGTAHGVSPAPTCDYI